MLRVGQKVVCVAEPPPSTMLKWVMTHGAVYPVKGKIYTIRDINVWPEKTLVHLVEIDNGHIGDKIEPGYPDWVFRPAVNTDISVFTAMLNKTPADELVGG